MSTRFRVSENDTIKGHLTIDKKLVVVVYDSGFSTISQVVTSLKSKVNDYDKRRKGEIYISISNQTKDTFKSITISKI